MKNRGIEMPYRGRREENMRISANAPYNFIPLNECVVNAQGKLDFNKYQNFSGYVDIVIETMTPLYIRREGSEFFSVDGVHKIPGSSLRGMIRTLVEIASFSKFRIFEDKRLYYREVIGKRYREKFANPDDFNSYKFKAGILKKEDDKYYIIPSKSKEGTQIYRIEQEKVGGVIGNTKPFNFHKVYFKCVKSELHPHSKRKLKYAKIESISLSQDSDHPECGFLIISGEFGKRKHMDWVINEPNNSNKTYLNKHLIKEYSSDKMRDEEINLLKQLEKHPEGVPCFYIEDNEGKISAFGHTGFFRLLYEHTIGEHIPNILKSEDTIDFAEAIFGVERKFSSRVFFEDAELLGNQSNIYLPETSPKILSSPKPTTFQHYLMQTHETDTPRNSLRHWDDKDAEIRGYKLYWHRNTHASGNYSWNEGEVKEDNVHTIIKPINEGVKFKGRIRFENLTREELGALLFVLELPENCHHKLGMGKPLGLGSIKITSELYQIYRENRYTSLFNTDNDEWNLSIERKQKTIDFKESFEKYILDNISPKDKDRACSLWDTPRLKELKIMLDFNNTKISRWLEKTRYMEINHKVNKNEFRERPVLPKPEKVVK